MKKFLLVAFLTVILALPITAMAKNENSASSTKASTTSTTSGNSANSNAATKSSNPDQSVSSNTVLADIVTGNAQNWKAKLDEYKQANQQSKITKLKALGETLIQNRITALENLKNRIEKMTSIEATVKAAQIADIEEAIAKLTTLKTKIQNDTDLATLKADIKSIFDTYKIYEVVLPRDLGQTATSNAQYILGRLSALEAKLEKIIAQNKNAGKNTTEIEKLVTDFQAKLTEAKTQLETAQTKFKAMTPANTEEAKTLRGEGKAALKQAKEALKSAQTILKNIVTKLKALETGTTTTTPTTSTTPTTTTTNNSSTTPTTNPLVEVETD